MEIFELIYAILVVATLCVCTIMVVRAFLSKDAKARDQKIALLEKDLENYRFLVDKIRDGNSEGKGEKL